jgi:hypothetical protein
MQRFARRRGFEEFRDGFCKLFDLASIDRFDNRLSTREMAIECADADAGAARNFLQAHIEPDIRKRRFGGVDQQLSVPGTISAGFACLLR